MLKSPFLDKNPTAFYTVIRSLSFKSNPLCRVSVKYKTLAGNKQTSKCSLDSEQDPALCADVSLVRHRPNAPNWLVIKNVGEDNFSAGIGIDLFAIMSGR